MSSWLSEKEYDRIFSQVPRLCIDLVIRDKGRILLSHRTIEPAKGMWHTPGGRVHFQEGVEKAVKRIAREETGLKVEIDKLLGFMQFPREKQDKKERHTVSLVFQVKPVGGNPRPDKNASAVKYFKSLPPRTYSVHRRFMQRARILK